MVSLYVYPDPMSGVRLSSSVMVNAIFDIECIARL